MNKNYITLDEGIKISSPRSFSALIKPVGASCNLECTYCYYLDKMRLYEDKLSVMSDEILEKMTQEYICSNAAEEINFVWHGGEPLLAGIEFFKKGLSFQKKYNKKGKVITNSIQTNGTLLNDEWCAFLKKNRFLVGLSLDGGRDIYNEYRKNRAGIGAFDKAIRGLELLNKHRVDYNILCVLNNLSEGKGGEIYSFLKSRGAKYIQFLPSVDYISEKEFYRERGVIVSPLKVESSESKEYIKAPWSISPKGYGEFLIDVFDIWVRNDVGKIFVQLFDMTLCSWCNIPPPLCAYRESCGDIIAVERDGEVYSCDHFVYPEHRLGNIMDKSIVEMISSEEGIKFGINKRNTLSKECLSCIYYFACKGECPKHRHEIGRDGEKKFTLCEGILAYYQHTEPYMKIMKELLMQEKPPSLIMDWVKQRG